MIFSIIVITPGMIVLKTIPNPILIPLDIPLSILAG